MACPVPAQPVRRRKRRRKAAQPGRTGPAVLLVALALVFSYAFYVKGAPAAQGQVGTTAQAPQLPEQVRASLPAGAVVLRAIPMADGSVAVAWREGPSARTGVAFAEPGGGYRLWVATTEGSSDVAAHAEVALTQLPGLSNPVLVSTYETEGCCAWVHIFALGAAPRVLFASPTHSSRLLASGIVVREPLPGEYPDGPAAHTHTYTWDSPSAQFRRTGLSLAPQYYFPLARGMKWTYRSGDTLVDRWVQEGRKVGAETEFVVRSVTRRGAALSEEPEATYTYGVEGHVFQRTPAARTVLGPSPALGSAWDGARVERVAESLRTPAGEFKNVLVVLDGKVRSYYAPNVGLIREEVDGRLLLDLVTYSIP